METVEPWTAHIRALIYGIQFERNPLDGLDRVMRQVVQAGALSATPNQYLLSIRKALASETLPEELLPEGHSEETIRDFLRELEQRIQAIV